MIGTAVPVRAGCVQHRTQDRCRRAIMIDIPQGIPSQIIDLAEKNVEQARGAFLGFIGAAQKATDAAETLPSSAKDPMTKAMSFVRGRNVHCWTPPAQIRASPIKALGSYLGYLTAKRAHNVRPSVRVPAPVTRFPGTVPGTCFAGPRSPRSPSLAPPAPQRIAPPCSSAS